MDNINKITLEDLAIIKGSDARAREEYRKRQDWWGGGLEIKHQNIYCQVNNPIAFHIDNSSRLKRIEDYQSIILKLINYPNVCSVSVNNKGIWRRLHTSGSLYWIFDSPPNAKQGDEAKAPRKDISEMESDPEVLELGEIAAKDRFHYNFMEIKIGYSENIRLRPLIGCVEYKRPDGQVVVVGYEVSFQWICRKFMKLKTRREGFEWCNGLWVPENYADLPSPALKRKKHKRG